MPNKTCSWGLCKNTSRTEGITFRKFPQPGTQKERYLEWIRRCGRPHDHEQLNIDHVDHYVCIEHFEEGQEDPVFACPYTKTPKSRKRKSRDDSSGQHLEKEQQVNALLERHVQTIPHSPVEEQPSTSTLTAPSPKKTKMNSKFENDCSVSITCNNCFSNIILGKKDLIDIDRKRFMEHVKESDDNCFHFTGVPNVATLWYIYFWFLPFTSNITLGPGPNKTRKALDLFEEYILTLVRIRRGYDVRFLSYLFGVSTRHVSRIFDAWVKFLSDCFSDLFVWPSQEINKKNLPKSFKDISRSTIAIIDCTEYFVKKPLRSQAQRLSYSKYKHANAFKQLIAIMPTGCITFVSKLYARNVSDQAIVKCCGLLEFLKPGDNVMADRSFNINHLVIAKKATLNVPAFSHYTYLSLKGVRRSRKISSVKTFAELSIRRMKTFKFLSGILPLRLRFQLNSITKIVAFLCNLQECTIK